MGQEQEPSFGATGDDEFEDLEASDPEEDEVKAGYKSNTTDGKYMIKKLPGRWKAGEV